MSGGRALDGNRELGLGAVGCNGGHPA